MSHPIALIKKNLFLTYIASNLLVGLVAPLFFAVMLPLSAVITLAIGCSGADIRAGFKKPLFQIALMFSVFMFITVPFSLNPSHSLGEAVQMAASLAAVAVLLSFPSSIPIQLNRHSQVGIFWLFLAFIAVLIILNLLVMFEVVGWQSHKMNRQAVVFALFLWPVRMVLQDLKSPLYTLSLVISLFIAVALGNSETALVMMIGGIAAFIFFKYFAFGRTFCTALFGTGLVVILTIPPLLAYLYQLRVTRPYEFLIGKTIHHLQLWSEALKEVVDHMPFGAGINVSRFFHELPGFVSYGFEIHHPHSISLELPLDFGIFGLILLALVIYAGGRLFWLANAESRPFIAATIIAMIVLLAVAFSFWQESRTGYIAFTLVLIRHHLQSREVETSRPR